MSVAAEPDIYFVKYPVELGKHVPMEILHQAAAIHAQRKGCEMKTFEYHGIIHAGPAPHLGKPEGHDAHLWSALQGGPK